MRFLPKNICEKLVKIGLKSESGFYWGGFYGEGPYGPFKGEPKFSSNEKSTPAFTLEDFVSTDEYAKENCRRLWPDKSEDGKILIKYRMNTPKRESVSHSDFFRQEIIKSKDWVEFIAETVEERSKL